MWGDPHYNTFDGATIDFYGTECKYLVSGVCKPSTGQNFSVIAKNEHRNRNYEVSWTRYVEVIVSNNQIILEQGKRAKVNMLLTLGKYMSNIQIILENANRGLANVIAKTRSSCMSSKESQS